MSAKDIRNIVLLGHGGSGKTTLAESMLFMTGGTDRFGKVTDGNTTCDYDAEEIKRNISISLAVAPVKYKNVKINVLDTPGNFDFAGEVLSGIRAAECAVLVCGAKDGLSVGAERAWKMLGNKPRMIFINRTDEENSDYNACFDALKGKFGTAVAPIVAPIIDGSKKVTGIVDLLHNKAYEVKGGKAAECAIPADIADEVEALRAELMEAAAGADEELMEKFFETMELSAEEIAKGLKLGVRDGSVAPVLCGSAISGLGVDMLMQTVLDLVPVATDMPAEAAQDDDGNAVEVAHDENGATAAIVFKTVSDQYGKFSLVKVVHDEVYGLGARRVGDDGVERQYPAAHDDAADHVQQHVVNQHKCTDGQPERLCKDDGDDLNAVHRAAVADGQAAADARDDAAEQRTQKQIRARQRRGNADIDGQHIGDEPGRHRVDADREDGVNREHRPLPLEAEQQQRDVEQDQEEGQRKIVRRQLGEQDGCAGDAAVVQLYRRNKQRYTDSIDDARDQQHQKMEGRELG